MNIKAVLSEGIDIAAAIVFNPLSWVVALLTIVASYYIPLWAMTFTLIACLGYTYVVCSKERPDEYIELAMWCVDAGQAVVIIMEALK